MAPSLKPDDLVIADILGGDREAFALLVRRHEAHVHAAAWAIVRDHHIAQDVTQESFIKAYQQLGTLAARRHFGAWVLTITRLCAIDRIRGKKRLAFFQNVPETPSSNTPEQESAAEVLRALSQLPAGEEQLLLLRYFDGLAVAEIAQLRRSPVGTITKQISRALARLRNSLKEKP